MSHERPVEPFSDLHVEGGMVRATLLHDPTVEGLDMAIYLDGSASMKEEYAASQKAANLWEWLTGGASVTVPSQVEPQARWMLQYLATKDRNGLLRVAYWACGNNGNEIQVVGDLTGADASWYDFPGPANYGSSTVLKPALADFTNYLKAQVRTGARRGCAVIITDGVIHDVNAVKAFSRDVAYQIATGQLPRLNFILVGVGDQINEEQMEDICHEEYPGVGHLWCHRIAAEIKQVAELVAALVDETMTVAAGGTIYDDRGQILKIYEARLPAVLEFAIPEGARSFTLEVNGQRYIQPIPEDDEHHEGEDDDDDDHH